MQTVLVVDDNPLMRESIRYELEGAGYLVVEAGNGRQALALLESFQADAAVVDIFMPEMDGIETLMELRRRMPGMAVIATSKGSETLGVNMLQHAETLGAHGVLPKPFSRDELLSMLRQALASVGPGRTVF